MKRRTFLVASTASVPLLAAFTGTGNSEAASNITTTVPDEDEHARTIAAMRPPKRARPLIAVVVDERGSETTDVLIPYAVLAASGVADVELVSATTEEVRLFPALTIRPQATLNDFESRFPEGADYVIVPASHRDDSPSLVPFVSRQASEGAIIVGICAGAKTLAAAGLLDGRDGTTHWFELEGLKRMATDMRWVPDRRYVVDSGVVTTTGVTASIPVSLAIVEAIGGYKTALELARRLGVSRWDASHDSSKFRLTVSALGTAVAGRLAFWAKQTIGIPVADGVDEISLALTADAWSRTYRSMAITISSKETVTSMRGIRFVVDRQRADGLLLIKPPRSKFPAKAIDDALDGIAIAFSQDVADFVALQLEYREAP